MKKLVIILAIMFIGCASLPMNNDATKRYDSHIDPDVFIKWQAQPVGFDNYGYLHVFFKNPDRCEPEFIEGAFKKHGNTWVLIMYRYRYHGQMYVYALTKDNRYTQISPKQSEI